MKINEKILEAAGLLADEIIRTIKIAQDEVRKEYEEKIRKAVLIAREHCYSRHICEDCNWGSKVLSEIPLRNSKIIEALDGWKYYEEK